MYKYNLVLMYTLGLCRTDVSCPSASSIEVFVSLVIYAIGESDSDSTGSNIMLLPELKACTTPSFIQKK